MSKGKWKKSWRERVKTFPSEEKDIAALRAERARLRAKGIPKGQKHVCSYQQRYLLCCSDEELLELASVKPKDRVLWIRDRLRLMELRRAWSAVDAAGIAEEALRDRNALRKVMRMRELSEEEARRGEGITGEELIRSARAVILDRLCRRGGRRVSPRDIKKMCIKAQKEYERLNLL